MQSKLEEIVQNKRLFEPTRLIIDIEDENDLKTLWHIFNMGQKELSERSKKYNHLGELSMRDFVRLDSLWMKMNDLCIKFRLKKDY